MNQFVQRHEKDVIGVLSGFDRVRLRGTLRWLSSVRGMMRYLSLVGVLLKEFKGFAMEVTERVRQASAAVAESAGRPLVYLSSSSESKEEHALRIARADGIESGLICVLSCVEPCHSYAVHKDSRLKQLRLELKAMKCLHQYFYFLDPQLGLTHVRLQTWFPFAVHICLNGRDWLACQMRAAGIDYVQRDNCFTAVGDVPGAQALLDAQLHRDWPQMCEELLARAHPSHQAIFGMLPLRYYWSIAESEWATDIMFDSPARLAALYPRLLRQGMHNFGSAEVMRFLGHKVPAHGAVHASFRGEVTSDLRRRPEGIRIKHRVGRNSIKMYDKQLSVLRVESTLLDVNSFKAFRTSEAKPHEAARLRRMRKGVADLRQRAQVSEAANQRYLQALAAVDEPQALKQLTAKLCQSVKWHGKSVRGLNPLAKQDAALLEAIARPEFTLNGCRNRDLRSLLFGSRSPSAKVSRQRAAKVTRQLRMLRAHRLIRKQPGTHRYLVTDFGRAAILAIMSARRANAQELLKLAA